MITESNIDYLFSLISKYSLEDYKKANPNYKPFTATGKNRNPKPYSLSQETIDAIEIYKVALDKNCNKEDEEKVKAYILKHKLLPY